MNAAALLLATVVVFGYPSSNAEAEMRFAFAESAVGSEPRDSAVALYFAKTPSHGRTPWIISQAWKRS